MCSDKADHQQLSSRYFILYVFGNWHNQGVWPNRQHNLESKYKRKIDSMNIGTGGALNRGLKLIKQLIRVFGCILKTNIRQRVEIDEMQCRFMSGHGGTTIAIFILSQLQKLLLNSNKPFYIAFINIEKDSRYVVCLLLNRVAGATDTWHDQGFEKQDNSWQLSQWEVFWCWWSSWLCSDSTALNFYVRGSNHRIQNRLLMVDIVQRWSGDQGWVHGDIAGEIGCMEVLEGEGSSCEHNICSHIKWSLELKCTKCLWHNTT